MTVFFVYFIQILDKMEKKSERERFYAPLGCVAKKAEGKQASEKRSPVCAELPEGNRSCGGDIEGIDTV